MATEEIDDAVFNIFYGLFQADTGTGGLNKNTQLPDGTYTSAAYLRGGFIRFGNPQATFQVPRIECEQMGFTDVDTPDHARAQGTVRLHIYCDKAAANDYTSGFLTQPAVIYRTRQVFHRATGQNNAGWYASTIIRKRGFQAPPTPTEQHYVVEFAVNLSLGTGGGFS